MFCEIIHQYGSAPDKLAQMACPFCSFVVEDEDSLTLLKSPENLASHWFAVKTLMGVILRVNTFKAQLIADSGK